MHFVQEPYVPGETIAAIATPPGEGGVAIIRISGNEALDVAEKIFSGPVRQYKTHTAHYGHIFNAAREIIDDVLLLVMLGQRSYTGEDTVEIQCHGGRLVSRRVLDAAIAAGARPARAGEFTFKAFTNGRIDLAQAEAVQELIAAKNQYALNVAEEQLRGRLSVEVSSLQQILTEIAAILEAWVDFPEEGLEFATQEEICDKLRIVSIRLEKLEQSYQEGRKIHDGISLCLIGSPNVGKSSLMNALLDKDRAIVTSIAGTTRDLLEDDLKIHGMNFRLIDTAGIRREADLIEQEGIRRSIEAMRKADLILLVMDASKTVSQEDLDILERVPHKQTLLVWNKCDLPHAPLPKWSFSHTVEISAKEKWGLESLHHAIDAILWKNGVPSKEEITITNARHQEAIVQAKNYCSRVIHGLQEGTSPEFVSMDLRASLYELGKLIGNDISEEILTAIFSKFCIGK